MQIERIIHSQGFGSRKECRALIRAGLVSIDGQVVDKPHMEFPVDDLVFEVEGEAWRYRPKAYLMMHKPGGCECSHQPQFHPSIYGLLPWPVVQRGVQSVGRLDQDTTRLILFSDDGQFIHTWSSGKKRIPKVYQAVLAEAPTEALVDHLLAGVQLHDEPEPVHAVACRITGERRIELTVTEGKYHMVKRMIAGVGGHVVQLHRQQIGGLSIPPDLLEGEWCWLEDEQAAALANWVVP
ncbi:MAG: 16S rRNA pseudouridine(516) synthase [Rhodocyclaceae bacterium]|nr:16S rRNA pseudouridine(516) synthase [Rhodocyclaceae bacterium]